MKSNIVIGISSGIAAFKVLDLVRELKTLGHLVTVVMTNNATQMLSPTEFEKASGKKVFIDLFEEDFDYKKVLETRHVEHVNVADNASVILVAPATANIIAKIAAGVADDFLTTTILAASSPVILAPSMNVHMWNNPVTQENIEKLKKRGFVVITPDEGALACGYEGPGRLPKVERLKEEVLKVLNKSNELKGKKILVTAGGTVEPIDDVRFIASKSSGKMGVEIAQQCFLRGAEVILLRSKTSVTPRYHIPQEIFETSEDLLELVTKHIKNVDIVFHTAAVSDFKPEKQSGKISSDESFSLKLTPQTKIINQIKKMNPNIKLIGFKAEWESDEAKLISAAQKKLTETNADAIVVNDVSRNDRGFGVDTNEVIIVTKDRSPHKIPLRSKGKIASEVVGFLIAA